MEELDHIALWNRCLKFIKENIPNEAYITWFEPIKPVKLENNTLTIQVPSQAAYEFIEAKYVKVLYYALKKEGGDIKLSYQVPVTSSTTINVDGDSNASVLSLPRPDNSRVINQFASPFETRRTLPNINPQLNPLYTFSNFMEGESNKMALVAGKSIAQNPGKNAFNPLFLYGPSGVGKTHLMTAVGIEAKYRNPQARVLYLSAQLFKVQYMDSIRQNRYNDFINFYQTIDVLIIDDVQELAGVSATQNTFFHIFNHLHQNGKQIILSADKPPVQISGLEDRLLTRFKWGLTVEMGRPDYELNKAILLQKIRKDGLNFPDDVVDYIAKNVTDNVRELEGVIASLLAYSIFQNRNVTLELAKRELSKYVLVTEKTITIDDIQEAVCKMLKLDRKLILSRSRKREIVQARQIAMYLSKKHTENSLSRIGEIIGKKDHATVLHACKTVKDQMEYDRTFHNLVCDIEASIMA